VESKGRRTSQNTLRKTKTHSRVFIGQLQYTRSNQSSRGTRQQSKPLFAEQPRAQRYLTFVLLTQFFDYQQMIFRVR
jgi:hypothetical protein